MELLGYCFLIDFFSLNVLPPHKKSYLLAQNMRTKEFSPDGELEFFPSQFRTDGSWQSHLLFALKYEGIELNVLKALFQKISREELVTLIQAKKLSIHSRRIWFFYELLTGEELPIPPLATGNYDYVLPPDEYFTSTDASAVRSKRQRLINNLPGNADFCPMVRMTDRIKKGIGKNYREELDEVLKKYPSVLIYRASSYMYLKETKSSYAIERQTPNQQRTAAFMAILQQAGRQEITKRFLIQLQNAIVDERYAEDDYRQDQVYVGQTFTPGLELVHFIGVKPQDVETFMEAWLSSMNRMISDYCDPIITTAVFSFAFVFIHPFGDGNGRIHRFLLHHILAAKKFSHENLVFPISAVLYKNQELYDSMLESFSKKIVPLTNYRLADDGTMTVVNETADFYRYIDFTSIVEKFFDVVEETLKTELVSELDYLIAWEHARKRMREIVDMPEQKAMLFIKFTEQNHGVFPKKRRELFKELSDNEILELTNVVKTEILQRATGCK
ncbi:MAG: Fic family protein [Victivallaceae bacterium]|nr:Fic family protein [Victivallaceae bacterium]